MFNDICNNILLSIFYYIDINYNILILKVIFINNVAIIFAKECVT